jgi:hypothetical protein
MASTLRALARAASRSSAVVSRARPFSTTASQASIDAFMEKFEAAKTSPSMEAPSTTSSFAAAPAMRETTAGTPEKLRLNFYLPHEAPHDGEEVRARAHRRSKPRIAALDRDRGSRMRTLSSPATRASRLGAHRAPRSMRIISYRACAPRPRGEIVSRRVELEGNATDPGSRLARPRFTLG